MKRYLDKTLSPETRAAALLAEMSLEEKMYQVTADMIFDVDGDYETRRNPLHGSYRNPGHFMHYKAGPADAAKVTEKINRDMRRSIEAQPHGVPPIENGEALHGAQWGMATVFPQPISMASSFDPALTEKMAEAIGRECSAVGVRQVFAPVVNVTRDCRWGRTIETFGEDVKLSCDMGAAMCRGLERTGVIATPKHYADNYAAGGRDSNYSETSERTMREVFLPPFKACFDAGAQSVMAAYNAWEGVPCSCNRRLLTDILREEWKFKGFVVSDYSGVSSVKKYHQFAKTEADAVAKSLKAGLDVILPYNSFEQVREAYDAGLLSEAELDRNVLRVLTAKFRTGIFDDPYRDADAASSVVRCEAHRRLALEAARESVILLKNNGVLPLQKQKIRKIGVFGMGADVYPVGSNYTGPYGTAWTADGVETPLSYLKKYLGDAVEIVTGGPDAIAELAAACDVNLYFTSLVEGEGSDRSDLRLPSMTVSANREENGGLIVDTVEQIVTENQEDAIRAMCAANSNAVVILLNGAPVDMTAWVDGVAAALEAWYPGEQGSRALTEILFGDCVPSAKLPITFPRSVGQCPLFYAYKPSGRGYGYCDNDGSPLYPFGYGLSYTSFVIDEVSHTISDSGVDITCRVSNTGAYDGVEVVQVYLGGANCDVVRPLKELKAYARVSAPKGGAATASLHLAREDFYYYDAAMRCGMHDGDYTVMVGASSADIAARFEVRVRNGSIIDGPPTPAAG